MDSLGSTTGLLEGRRGSVLGMHPTVTPSVHIVNPTLTTATAPSPPSMTVRSGVTHRPNNTQQDPLGVLPLLSGESFSLFGWFFSIVIFKLKLGVPGVFSEFLQHHRI